MQVEKIVSIETEFEQGNIDSVIEKVALLSTKEQSDPRIFNILGIINLHAAEYGEAKNCFESALKTQPQNISYLMNLEYTYEKLNYFRDAKLTLDMIKKYNINQEVSAEEIQLIEASLKDKLKNKNVLMLAYYYPPLSGSGVFRSMQFAKYLSQSDWNVSVISTTQPPRGWNFKDDSMCTQIPDNVTVKRIDDPISTGENTKRDIQSDIKFLSGIFCELDNVAQLFRNIIGVKNGIEFLSNFPCECLNWAHNVADYIDERVRLNNFDVVYTTSGPSSSHLIGYYINKKYNIPWVADFRDQWVFNPYANNDLSSKNVATTLLYHLEYLICHCANHVICPSEIARDSYITKYDLSEDRIASITNGYDEDDFSNLNYSAEKNKKFTIYYGGLAYSKERSLAPVIEAINQLIAEKLVVDDDVFFNFSGFSSEDLDKIIGNSEISKNYSIKPYQHHDVVLKEMISSDLLVCLIGDGERYHSVYTGKIFEYLRSGVPILTLASEDGLVGKVLEQTGHGKAMPSTDIEMIKVYILSLYNEWKAASEKTYVYDKGVERFNRKTLTKELSNVLKLAITNKDNNKSKKEISSYLYDVGYKGGGAGGNYFENYSKSIYYSVWLEAVRRILFLDKKTSIVDIGCGVGQFANMLFDYGFINYRGLDYSKQAIEMAKTNNKEHCAKFWHGNAFTDGVFDTEYDLVILFEILEHISDDLQIISRIKSGTNVMLSVPNFTDPKHVRFFKNKKEVADRFGEQIDILDIASINLNAQNVLFLLIGTKK